MASAPRKRRPEPAPVTMPPITKTTRLGTHMPAASSARPGISAMAPSRSVCGMVTLLAASCARAPEANAAKATAPASACEVWCSVVARKLGARELNTP